MRGAVSAGMCLVLEAAGLMSSVDRVYGCSSGALSGCFAAAGQASLWATSFEDCARREFIDRSRALRGRPMLDLDFLFDEVIARRRPLSEAGLAVGPEFRAVAVSASRAQLRVLRDFESAADALAAARASCSIPVLTGTPPIYRGEPTVDGGLLEPIPYRTALRDGATHVLVLRSRDTAIARRGRAGSRSGRSLAPILSSCRCCAAAARSTTATPPSSSAGRANRPSCSRSPYRPTATWCRGSASIAPASSTASGWARTRWRPPSTARAPRGSGSRSPTSCRARRRSHPASRPGDPSRAGGRGGPTSARRPRRRG